VAERVSRKELKAPDAFQKAGTQAREWLQGRQTQVAIGVGVALVVLGGVALVSYFSERSDDTASQELGQALKVLDRPVVEGTAAQPPPLPGQEPPFKTAREKDEATVKALTEFRTKHSGSQAATTAALPLGQAALRLGDADLALTTFGEYVKKAPKDWPMRASALEGQGYAHEAKGQLDQALAAFEQMAQENKTDYLNGMGLYHRARILILQSKKEDAAKALSEVSSTYPGSAAARLAADRLALLASEGVKIPEPSTATAPDAGG